ncbi:MATE family efflux transporter [Brevibacillus laterosporus]|uniref:MATE family efflux transporter n=1 Tax=Brevibacillus laterosporus TaxID=1465 RepID=UPI003D25D041
MTDAAIKLRETPVPKLFISYLIPSVLGMLLMSINIFVDGVFVSRGVGPEGLAGVNISVPAFSIFLSISLWIGMGGATLYSAALGRNEVTHARQIFTQSFALALLLVSLIMAVCLTHIEQIAYIFGADKTILPYALDYLHVLLTFGIVYVLENILSIFIRNDGNPKLAMMGLIVTSVLNILFNYIFIFMMGMGVKGAAYATILSAAIGFLVLLTHFWKKGSTLRFVAFRFQLKEIRQIVNIGFPSFIAESTIAITTLAYNLAFMKYLGAQGVAAYAIVNYIHAMLLLLFMGVGAALQPIASFHYGAQLSERLQASLRLTVKTGWGFGIAALLFGVLFSNVFIMLFDIQSEELIQITVNGMNLFFINYLFLGYNLVYGEYFQAIQKIRKSLWIILTRGVLLVIPLVFILPKWFGVNGIWLAIPIAEALTALGIRMLNRKTPPVPQFTKRETEVTV